VSASIKQIKSTNQRTAAEQLDTISGFADAMEVLRRRGGVTSLLETAKYSEADCRKLVRALKQIRERAVQAIIDIGDQRRAEGKAIEVCWLPESDGQAEK
jgi:hypothetical protein